MTEENNLKEILEEFSKECGHYFGPEDLPESRFAKGIVESFIYQAYQKGREDVVKDYVAQNTGLTQNQGERE